MNALIQLAETQQPLIRNIKQEGQRSARWVPVDASDDDIDVDDTYASDFERISEAVDRAVKRLGRPVNVNDVGEEIARDRSLQLASKLNLANMTSEAAKELLGVKGLPRRTRITRRVFRAGSINDTSYYYNDLATLPSAKSYVSLRRSELLWAESGSEEDLEGIKLCSLSTVAAGRAKMAVAEINRILQGVNEEIESQTMDDSTLEEALVFRHKLSSALTDANEKSSFYNTDDPTLPTELDLAAPGWTALELLPIISPLYPAARSISRPSQLIPLLDGKIRRVRNPEYTNRFINDPRTASEFLFDRTGALLYMAINFGGRECRLQARLARNELGLLRDPRFIFPSLGSNNFHHRLIGVACLAFLRSDEGNKHLRRLAVEDPDQGVRQSALWAYCFTNASDGWELFRSQASDDPDQGVRSFAANVVMEANNNGTLWEV